MGLFDRFRRPAGAAEPSPQGRCTQPVSLEANLRPENGGAEAWFFTLSEEGQKRLLVEGARRGLAAVSQRYRDRVSIDLAQWTRHAMFFNGTRDGGRREAITRLMFYADPAVAEEAARAAFDGVAAHLHAMYGAAR